MCCADAVLPRRRCIAATAVSLSPLKHLSYTQMHHIGRKVHFMVMSSVFDTEKEVSTCNCYLTAQTGGHVGMANAVAGTLNP
jgi:ribosomal protein S9